MERVDSRGERQPGEKGGRLLGGGTLGTAVLPPGADSSAAGLVFELLSAALTSCAQLSILNPVSLQDSRSGPPLYILDFPPPGACLGANLQGLHLASQPSLRTLCLLCPPMTHPGSPRPAADDGPSVTTKGHV